MPARTGKLAVACAAALAFPGAIAGCGGKGVTEVEDQVGSELKAQLARQDRRNDLEGGTASAQVDRVDCPDDVDTGAGSMFRCRALDKAGGVVGTVTVTMREGGDPSWQFVAAPPS